MAQFQQDVTTGNGNLYMKFLGGHEDIFTGMWPKKGIL